MITVILAVCLALGITLAVICGIFVHKDPYDNHLDRSVCCGMVAGILLLAFVGVFIADMVLVADINTANVYDAQIAIVEEENTELEEQICSAVENYLKHEGDIFQSLDITTAIGLYSAYPNLKSNELMQSLIETYQANTSEIKALKMKKTEVSKWKWLVYFGH